MRARLAIGAAELATDLAQPVSLAAPVEFTPDGMRHFGAPAASALPLTVPGFTGAVARGASCNCSSIRLTPHCNGTHTECVGHLTAEPLDAWRVVPAGLLPALLLDVAPASARATAESSDPVPRAGDRLVTRAALESAWPAALPFAPRALVVRTGASNAAAGDGELPPYLTHAAAALLRERGIEHLVIDLPSVDRLQDEGRLTAHRVFFGLPPATHELARAARAQCTITELARIPETLAPGAWLLELQVPALAGDAVPSRPLLYPVLPP